MIDVALSPAPPQTDTARNVLHVDDLHLHYNVRQGLQNRTLRAVDGVSLHLKAGECLGLVGESGCGKSSLAQAILGIVPPTSGRVEIDGVTADPARPLGGLARARAIQMVFQDPYSSLNPRMTIRQTLTGPLRLHRLCPAEDMEPRIRSLLERVGLEPDAADRYPHAFSGGQRQRLCIARALVVEPRILVCDEPVSALDVSIRAQIINLLLRLKDELGLALLMISHDLGVVEHMSDRIAVMYLGRFVEEGRWDQVLSSPAHPYTRALLASVPGMNKDGAGRLRITGEAPSALRPPKGCAFHPRCTVAFDACRSGEAPGVTRLHDGHQARCHLLKEGASA